jgi:hypothetical protein
MSRKPAPAVCAHCGRTTLRKGRRGRRTCVDCAVRLGLRGRLDAVVSECRACGARAPEHHDAGGFPACALHASPRSRLRVARGRVAA